MQVKMPVDTQDNNSIFTSASAIVDGTDLWLLTNETDILCHFNLDSMKLMDYFFVPGKEMLDRSHFVIRKNKNKIYIIPYKAEHLYIFDVLSQKFKECQIPYGKNQNNKFMIAETYGTYLVMIGHEIHGIIYYDEETDTFVRYTDYLTELESAGCDISKPLFLDGYCRYENRLYIPVFSMNLVLQLNLEDATYNIYELLGEKEIKLRTIDRYNDGGEKFLLTTVDDEMLIWSINYGIEKMKKLEVLKGDRKAYVRAFCINRKNYYISAWERKVFVENGSQLTRLDFDYENRGAFDELNYTQFEAIFRCGEDIFFQARSNGQIFKIDTRTDEVNCVNFNVTQEEKEKIIYQVCKYRNKVKLLMESSFCDLNLFLRILYSNEQHDGSGV